MVTSLLSLSGISLPSWALLALALAWDALRDLDVVAGSSGPLVAIERTGGFSRTSTKRLMCV